VRQRQIAAGRACPRHCGPDAMPWRACGATLISSRLA
jgi:hypothetical protein